ncbi:MAG: hypothetical protein NTX64_07955 [Elusimicrobia bacterium]|nr:hypothetical protein [Elusimicrobiota bacterium]
MDLYLALTAAAWAVGGMFCACWLAWLDRSRREIPVPVKCAVLVGWPMLMPYLLYQRGDLTAWQACLKAAVWVALLSAGFGFDALQRVSEPPAARPAEEGARLALPAPTEPVGVAPLQIAFPESPSEADRREAVKHWNSGIIYYQKGDYEKSQEEWSLCRELDPGNSDCLTGLQRLDMNYGVKTTPVSARQLGSRFPSTRWRAAKASGP